MCLQRSVLAGGDDGCPRLLEIERVVAVPHVVDEARSVRHQLAQRDLSLRRAQLCRAAGIETFQHLRRSEIGQQLADRFVQRELALLDQLHAGGGRDRLGHRGDPEHAVGGHRIVLAEVALAERALINRLASGGRHRNDTGDFLRVALLSQQLVDLRLGLHGVASVRLLLWRAAILLPCLASGKRARVARGARSRFRDGRRRTGGGAAILQHFVTISGGQVARSMTAHI